jgi:hypothetical protein
MHHIRHLSVHACLVGHALVGGADPAAEETDTDAVEDTDAPYAADCDDGDQNIRSHADDIGWDSVDQDCDGADLDATLGSPSLWVDLDLPVDPELRSLALQDTHALVVGRTAAPAEGAGLQGVLVDLSTGATTPFTQEAPDATHVKDVDGYGVNQGSGEVLRASSFGASTLLTYTYNASATTKIALFNAEGLEDNAGNAPIYGGLLSVLGGAPVASSVAVHAVAADGRHAGEAVALLDVAQRGGAVVFLVSIGDGEASSLQLVTSGR